MKPTVCVDLDGVLASWDHGTFHEIGPPICGAVEFTHRLSELADIVIYTCRCTEELYPPQKAHLLANEIRRWLDLHNFMYASIWTGQGKPIANAYIDDRAVTCRPEKDHNAFQRAEAKVTHLLTE